MGAMRLGRKDRVSGPTLLGAAVLVASLGLAACGVEDPTHHPPRFPLGAEQPPTVEVLEKTMTLERPTPPLVYEYEGEALKCSECHEKPDPADLKRRELTAAHTDIVFEHDQAHRWCLDCHDADNRDMFRLANGTLVAPDESYRLCGQCHGDKFRDWRAGVHGRRTGHWDGQKTYLLCVHCHDAHSPRFKPIKPEPTPRRPEEIR